MKIIKSRRTPLEEMFVLGALLTAVALNSLARHMTLGLWIVLVGTTVLSMAASAAAASRNNRRWFIVSGLAVLSFLILLGLRFQPAN